MGKIYGGVSGTAREVKAIYAGVGGVAKLIWEQSGGSWRDVYQQVEFIQGTGTQYINVGYVITSTSVMTAEFQMTTTSASAGTYFLGATSSNGRFGVGINASGSFLFGLGGGYHARSANTNKQTLVINNSTKRITQNGTNRTASSGSYSTVTNPNWFGILGSYNTDNVLTFGKVKVYHIAIQEANASDPSHDYYPVYRKSDNEPGVYDIVTGNFYTNSGTGTIIVGDPYIADL